MIPIMRQKAIRVPAISLSCAPLRRPCHSRHSSLSGQQGLPAPSLSEECGLRRHTAGAGLCGPRGPWQWAWVVRGLVAAVWGQYGASMGPVWGVGGQPAALQLLAQLLVLMGQSLPQ